MAMMLHSKQHLLSIICIIGIATADGPNHVQNHINPIWYDYEVQWVIIHYNLHQLFRSRFHNNVNKARTHLKYQIEKLHVILKSRNKPKRHN